MSTTTPKRLYYQARILVAPLGPSGVELVDAMARSRLTGVRVVLSAEQSSVRTRDIQDIESDGATETMADLASSADMLVFVGSELHEVDEPFTATVATAARNHGVLLAGVVVDQHEWDAPRGGAGMAILRRELDMLVMVTELALATSFIDVLKGGRRNPIAPPLVDALGAGS